MANIDNIINNATGITSDSRLAEQGNIFVAIKGAQFDGTKFIPQAIDAGAIAVLAEADIDCSIPVIVSNNIRKEYAKIAAKIYQPKPKILAAVTGTNGKTSVAHFYRQICSFNGIKTASIGTLGVVTDETSIELNNTSPDAGLTHKYLAELKQQDYDNVIIEASSIGIEQHRLDALPFNVAGFTSFTQDHLDYHNDMDTYFACKQRLFTELLQGKAIINADIPEFSKFSNPLGYGKNGEYLKIQAIHNRNSGQEIELIIDNTQHNLFTKLLGEFQVYNLACAIGMAMQIGITAEDAIRVARHVTNVPGRLEYVTTHNNASIYVDYAHTPDALENALKTMRPYVASKLAVLFGCGGDRDTGKRPQMGKIANDLADIVIVTDDNPRNEDASQIRAEILKTCPNGVDIADRKEAIKHGIKLLSPGDILLLAGKGHEHYQIIGDEVIEFDDRSVVKEVISKL